MNKRKLIMANQKRNRQFENSMSELMKPRITDILLCIVLLCCAAVSLVLYFKAPHELVIRKSYNAIAIVLPLCDIVLSLAVFFKGGFFRWFSLTAIMARLKGVERNRIYPTTMYLMAIKIFALIMCLVNLIFLILVIKLI